MSTDARRKERQRLKREKKKAAHRRAMSVSLYKRIGQAGEMEACYINADWQESGIATIHVIRRNPAGGHAMAAFLVDVWCAGLKDTWGALDLLNEDIKLNLHRARETVELVRIDADVAQRFVAAGIRFARQNGFKLPAHFDRWTNLLGGVGDINSADLGGFGKDGKLCWVGPLEDLRKRLIASTVEEFLARPDVDFASEVEPAFEDEEDEEIDEQSEEFGKLVQTWRDTFDSLLIRISDTIRGRLEQSGQPIPLELEKATRFLFAGNIYRDFKERPEDFNDGPSRAYAMAAGNIIAELFPASMQQFPESLKKAAAQIAEIFHEVSDSFMGSSEAVDALLNALQRHSIPWIVPSPDLK